MRRLRALILPALLAPLPALAQSDEAPEIVVTGRGLEAPPGDVAYAVVTIDRDRLSDSGSLEDALGDVAGVAQFRRSDSRSAHPTSQGVTLRGLGGNAASRALLILDGVPQADPFGGWVAFPAYLPERLGSMRVVRGGGSGFSGPGALAGTIELASGSPAELDPLLVSLAGGSRASFDGVALAAIPLGSGFATLAGRASRGDGFVPVVAENRGPADRAAPYAQQSLALRSVFPAGDRIELQANASGFRDRRDRGVDFTRIASDGADASLRAIGRGRWRWSALAYLQMRDFASGFASVDTARATASPVLDQRVPSTGVGGRIEIEPPMGAGITLRLGMDARRVSGETRERYLFTGIEPTRRRNAGGHSVTLGSFADLSVESGPLTLDVGGRIDRWRIGGGHLVEAPLAGGSLLTDAVFPDRSGWEATGRAGAALEAVRGVTLRAAGYRGWRLPTLNELYRPFRVGADATAANAALDPERLWGAEAGIAFGSGRGFGAELTAYWNRLDGAIANVTLASGPGNFPGVGFVSAAGVYRQRRNLDAVVAKGVELDLHAERGPWRARLSTAITDSRVHASGAAAALDVLRPAQTTTLQGSATLGWRRDGTSVSLTARYHGPQYEDDLNQRQLDEAVTLDAVADLPLTNRIVLTLRGENLFDARVEAGISGADVIERATPRTLWLGLRYGMR